MICLESVSIFLSTTRFLPGLRHTCLCRIHVTGKELPGHNVALHVSFTSNLSSPLTVDSVSLDPQPGFTYNADILNTTGLLPLEVSTCMLSLASNGCWKFYWGQNLYTKWMYPAFFKSGSEHKANLSRSITAWEIWRSRVDWPLNLTFYYL